MIPEIDTTIGAWKLGHVPTHHPHNVSAYPVGSVPLVPREKWAEFDLTEEPEFRDAVPIKDQDGRGACNYHAAASSLEGARFLSGLSVVELCPWFGYAIACRGRDIGSNIGEALTLLRDTGLCRFGSVPYATIDPNKLTRANYEEAKDYRIEIGYPALSFDELMSLTQLRIPFNFSIRVAGGFERLDSEGCPPVAAGPGNHAVCGGLGARKMKNGKWAIKWQNSWRKSFGLGGYAWCHEGHFTRQSYFEAYGVFAPLDTPGDPRNPPAVLV